MHDDGQGKMSHIFVNFNGIKLFFTSRYIIKTVIIFFPRYYIRTYDIESYFHVDPVAINCFMCTLHRIRVKLLSDFV